MPDLDQIKRGTGARDGRGRFAGGRSGDPAGRPRGCRDHVNHAARLLLAGEGETLTRKAVELALAGDSAAAEAQDRARGHAFTPKIHCVPSVEVVCSSMVRFAQSTIWWWPV